MRRLDLRACASRPLIVCVTWDQMQQEPRMRMRSNKAGGGGSVVILKFHVKIVACFM